jgi:hypothetical protein
MAKRKNLQLERRAAPKQPDERSDEPHQCGPERQSMYERKPSMYQSDRGFLERSLRTPIRAPKANSFCERFGGTLRRECLDFLIPFNERHLRLVLKTWMAHFNHARPHMSLGPGIPAPLRSPAQKSTPRHAIAVGHTVQRAAVLGGLHHEYWPEAKAA